jgi:hypothetical protein
MKGAGLPLTSISAPLHRAKSHPGAGRAASFRGDSWFAMCCAMSSLSPPAMNVPLSASERHGSVVLGVVPSEKSERSYLNIPLAAEPWLRCGPPR